MLASNVGLFSPAVFRVGGEPAPPPETLTLHAPGGSSGFAPFGAIFEVNGGSGYGSLPDGPFPVNARVNYHHVWDFGDASSGNFEPVNLPAPFSNGRNSMTGPVAAHVYETAGTYTVTLSIYNSLAQLVGRGTMTVTVSDPDTYFGSDNTIVFSSADDFTGAPAAAHQITTLSALHTQLDAWSGRARQRVLFRRGETVTFDDSDGSLHLNNVSQGAMFGSFGDAADPQPLLRMDGSTQASAERLLEIGSGDAGRAVFTGIKVDGRYDPVTPNYPSGVRPVQAFVCRTAHGLIHKCETENVHMGAHCLTNVDTDEFIVSEMTANGWSDYGALISSYRSAVIGSSIKQDPNTFVAANEKDLAVDFISDHGPVRCSGLGPGGNRHRHVSYANDLFSRGGWSAGLNQPCLRLLGDSDVFFLVNVQNNRMEGGQQVLTLSTSAAHFASRGQALVSGNYLIGDDQTENFIRASRYGMNILNNVFVKPDVAQAQGTLNRFFTWDHPGAHTVDGFEWPVRFVYNTCINLQSSANAGPLSIQAATTEGGTPLVYDVGDNIIKADGAPNAASLTDYDPLDSSNYYRPEAGSAAIAAGTETKHPVDFARNFRSGDTSVGAWHTA